MPTLWKPACVAVARRRWQCAECRHQCYLCARNKLSTCDRNRPYLIGRATGFEPVLILVRDPFPCICGKGSWIALAPVESSRDRDSADISRL